MLVAKQILLDSVLLLVQNRFFTFVFLGLI